MWERFALLNLVKRSPASKRSGQGAPVSIGDASPPNRCCRNAELFHLLQKRANDFGFKFDNLSYDWSKIISRSRGVADKLAGGVEFLFKKNKIDYLRGEASITGPGKVVYKTKENREETIESDNILISTGAVSRDLPGLAPNGKTILEQSRRHDPGPAAEAPDRDRRGGDRR